MDIRRLAGLLSVLVLAACQGAGQPGAVPPPEGFPTQWHFNFFTPWALHALVTYAAAQDAEGNIYRFNTLDSTKALHAVIGKWSDSDRPLNGHWNHVAHPLKRIVFCWDSVIDKKVYETHLTLPDSLIEQMHKPSIYKNKPGHIEYYKAVQIGLAPGGKVAVWLSGVVRGEPSYRVTPSVLNTVSGDKLNICKGITRHPNGYKYYGDTTDFIKGKKYPYGNW